MVEKLIKGNTIDASIVYDEKTGNRYLQSYMSQNVYQTTEPQFTFDSRIKSCLELHNMAVKALRYPPDTKNESIESADQQREREMMVSVVFDVFCRLLVF